MKDIRRVMQRWLIEFGICLVLLIQTPLLQGEEIRLYPAVVHLQGNQARQRVLAVKETEEQTVVEEMNKVKLQSSRPDIVRVEEGGWLVAQADGQAEIMIAGESSSTKANSISVRVSGTKAAEPPSFLLEIIPAFTRIGCNAGSCHGALAGKGGLKLSLRGFDPESDHFVLTRQAIGRRVDLRHPVESLMLLKPTATIKHGGGHKIDVDSAEYALLKRWIEAGAPGPKPNEIKLSRLEAFPPSARLKPEATIPVLVQATYSDGHTADVTRWVKFGSSEEQVLHVADDGQVTVMGHGAAAVTVWYSNHVTTVNVLVPYAAKGQAGQYVENNFIDRHVNQRLKELRLPGSPTCSDNEFIRRVFLDTLGILPTTEEVRTVVTDRTADKRTKLI